jgi:hypothetical protein
MFNHGRGRGQVKHMELGAIRSNHDRGRDRKQFRFNHGRGRGHGHAVGIMPPPPPMSSITRFNHGRGRGHGHAVGIILQEQDTPPPAPPSVAKKKAADDNKYEKIYRLFLTGTSDSVLGDVMEENIVAMLKEYGLYNGEIPSNIETMWEIIKEHSGTKENILPKKNFINLAISAEKHLHGQSITCRALIEWLAAECRNKVSDKVKRTHGGTISKCSISKCCDIVNISAYLFSAMLIWFLSFFGMVMTNDVADKYVIYNNGTGADVWCYSSDGIFNSTSCTIAAWGNYYETFGVDGCKVFKSFSYDNSERMVGTTLFFYVVFFLLISMKLCICPKGDPCCGPGDLSPYKIRTWHAALFEENSGDKPKLLYCQFYCFGWICCLRAMNNKEAVLQIQNASVMGIFLIFITVCRVMVIAPGLFQNTCCNRCGIIHTQGTWKFFSVIFMASSFVIAYSVFLFLFYCLWKIIKGIFNCK